MAAVRAAASALAAALALSPAQAAEGSAARGRALFEVRCAGCHAHARLAGKGARLERDLARVDRAMRPVGLLAEAEVADLAAYLDEGGSHGDRDH
jgi:mono/diheme cytochrome c family protein